MAVGRICSADDSVAKRNIVAILHLFLFASNAHAVEVVEWVRQLSTSAEDEGHAISTDNQGNIFVGGFTRGTLAEPNEGAADAFLAKFRSDGERRWTSQLGVTNNDPEVPFPFSDFVRAVHASPNGSIHTALELGVTVFNGEESFDTVLLDYDDTDAGANDEFTINSFDRFGASFGTKPSGLTSDDSENLYYSGVTTFRLPGGGFGTESMVVKYDAAGLLQWDSRINNHLAGWEQYPGQGWAVRSNTVDVDDSGNVYVAGEVNFDGFVSKLSASGQHSWSEFFAAPGDSNTVDEVHGVAADNQGNVYVAGVTYGPLDGEALGGRSDMFVTKYRSVVDGESESSERVWTRLIGSTAFSPGHEQAYDIDLGPDGSLYVAGTSHFGSSIQNATVVKLDPNGNELWTHVIGQGFARALTVADDGAVYVTGVTDDILAPEDVGPVWFEDAFVLKLVEVPDGDFNRDGIVDAADYTVWRDNFGATGSNPYDLGDGDGDGDTDGADYLVWQRQYGMTSSAVGAVSSLSLNVPEPSTLHVSLAALLLVGGITRRIMVEPSGKDDTNV